MGRSVGRVIGLRLEGQIGWRLGAAALLAASMTMLRPLPAQAAPLAAALTLGGGVRYERGPGVFRDDPTLALRFLDVAVSRRVAIDLGLGEGLERFEVSVRLGASVRPWLTTSAWSPYVRVEAALLGGFAIPLLPAVELVGGVGLWRRLTPRLALFLEVDVLTRVTSPRTLSDHLLGGFSITSPTFWR